MPREFVAREPAALLFCGYCQQHYWSDLPHSCSVDPLRAAKGIFHATVASLATFAVIALLLLAAGVIDWSPWRS